MSELDDKVSPGDIARVDQVHSQMQEARAKRGEDQPIEVAVRFALVESESLTLLAETLVHMGESILSGIADDRDVPLVGNSLALSYFVGDEGPHPATIETRYLTSQEVADHNTSTDTKPGEPLNPPPPFLLMNRLGL